MLTLDSIHDSDSSIHYTPGEPLVVLEQPDFAVSAVELLEGDIEGGRGDARDAGCQFNSIKMIWVTFWAIFGFFLNSSSSLYRGLLHEIVCFETYLPVGTNLEVGTF